MTDDQDYTPISCASYSELELAIMHKQWLRVAWKEHGADHVESLLPLDLETRKWIWIAAGWTLSVAWQDSFVGTRRRKIETISKSPRQNTLSGHQLLRRLLRRMYQVMADLLEWLKSTPSWEGTLHMVHILLPVPAQ